MGAQIDRIIIRFDIVGGKQAQMLLSGISKLLIGINPAAAKGKAGMTAFAQATGTGAVAMNKFGNSIDTNVIKISEFAVVIFALAAAYKILVQPVVDVNKNMKIVESVSHATTAELKALKDEAIRLGTIFPGGAAKATEALVAIGQAGFDTAQSMQLMGPVFQLATIGQVEFADAVELSISVLNAFNKPVSESSQIVDTLAASISHTLTTFETFSVALPALASLSQDLGVEFEEVVVLLGHLRDRGIPASRTATSLKNVFTELTKETINVSEALKGTTLKAEDFDIKAQGLQTVLMNVAESGLSVAQKLDLLGLRGIYASSILDEDLIGSLWNLIEALKESGEASFQSGTMLEATASKWAQLSGEIGRSLEEVWEPALAVIDKLIEWLKGLVRALRTTPEWVKFLTRLIFGLTAGFTALALIVKANILLFKNFLWQHGIAAAIPTIVKMIASIKGLSVVMGMYTAGTLSATMATRAFLAVLLPVGIALAVTGAAIGAMALGIDSYKKSLRGQADVTDDVIRAQTVQLEQLQALKKRLKAAQTEHVLLTKEGKSTAKSFSEILLVLIELGKEFPEIISDGDTFVSMLGDIEGALDGTQVGIDGMIDKLSDLGFKMDEIERKRFFGVLMEAVGTTSLFDEAKAAAPKVGGFEDLAKVIVGKGSGNLLADLYIAAIGGVGGLQETAVSKKHLEAVRGGTPGGLFRAFFAEHTGLANPDDATIFQRMTGPLTEKLLNSLTNAIEDANLEPVEQAVADKMLQLFGLRYAAQVAADEAGKKEGPPGPPGPDDDGGAFVVPGLIAFDAAAKDRRARQKLELAETELLMRQLGMDELLIEQALSDLKKRQLIDEKKIFDIFIAYLEVQKIFLTDAKEIAKVDKEIVDLKAKRLDLESKTLTLRIEDLKIEGKRREEIIKLIEEEEKALEASLTLKEKLRDTIGDMADIQKEINRNAILGKAFGLTNLEIAEGQLRILEGEISRLMNLLDDLPDLLGDVDEAVLKSFQNMTQVLIDNLLPKLKLAKDEVERLERREAQEKIYKDTREAVEKALVDALLSGNVKDAINAFADLIKQALAEKLAVQIADEMGSLIGGLSSIAGGAGGAGPAGGLAQGRNPKGLSQQDRLLSGGGGLASGAAGAAGATGAAATLGWIGVGLMAIDLLSGLFSGGKKIDKLDTKLDYILRGSGYQLPPSFLLPEDQGEFSLRRQGKDSLALRFPQRQLSVVLTHKFEWNPAELARAVGSDISTGGMAGTKQFSNMDG